MNSSIKVMTATAILLLGAAPMAQAQSTPNNYYPSPGTTQPGDSTPPSGANYRWQAPEGIRPSDQTQQYQTHATIEQREAERAALNNDAVNAAVEQQNTEYNDPQTQAEISKYQGEYAKQKKAEYDKNKDNKVDKGNIYGYSGGGKGKNPGYGGGGGGGKIQPGQMKLK